MQAIPAFYSFDHVTRLACMFKLIFHPMGSRSGQRNKQLRVSSCLTCKIDCAFYSNIFFRFGTFVADDSEIGIKVNVNIKNLARNYFFYKIIKNN